MKKKKQELWNCLNKRKQGGRDIRASALTRRTQKCGFSA